MADEEKVKEQKPLEVKEDVKEKKEDATVEEVTEKLKEDATEVVEEKEEVKEEPKVEEKKEEVTEEKVDEEPKVEEPVVEDNAELKEEIKKSSEQLAVIKEVKAELVTLYTKNKELEMSVEKLSVEKAESEKTVEKLSKDLDIYKQAELDIAAEKQKQFVEKLSVKYSQLGQEKTVEHLSKLDDVVLVELNEIADLAVEQLGKTEKSKSEIIPSQGKTSESLSKDEIKAEETKEVKPVKKAVAQTTKEWAQGIAGQLAELETQPGKSVSFM